MISSEAKLLSRLLYTSRVCDKGILDPALVDPEHIATSASKRNKESGVTGCLVYVEGQFIQILEGPPTAVEITFERICRDLRHADVRLVDLVATTERVFEGWSMACLDGRPLSDGKSERVDYLSEIKVLSGLNASQAITRMREALNVHTATI